MHDHVPDESAVTPVLTPADRRAAVALLEDLLAEVRSGRIDGSRPAIPAALDAALIALRSLDGTLG